MLISLLQATLCHRTLTQYAIDNDYPPRNFMTDFDPKHMDWGVGTVDIDPQIREV